METHIFVACKIQKNHPNEEQKNLLSKLVLLINQHVCKKCVSEFLLGKMTLIDLSLYFFTGFLFLRLRRIRTRPEIQKPPDRNSEASEPKSRGLRTETTHDPKSRGLRHQGVVGIDRSHALQGPLRSHGFTKSEACCHYSRLLPRCQTLQSGD